MTDRSRPSNDGARPAHGLRNERLKAALKANIARRKEQARGRRQTGANAEQVQGTAQDIGPETGQATGKATGQDRQD
jgi:hypothetical protein